MGLLPSKGGACDVVENEIRMSSSDVSNVWTVAPGANWALSAQLQYIKSIASNEVLISYQSFLAKIYAGDAKSLLPQCSKMIQLNSRQYQQPVGPTGCIKKLLPSSLVWYSGLFPNRVGPSCWQQACVRNQSEW